jgi:hypothetical protein
MAAEEPVDARALVGVVGMVVALWWVTFGRTTPFPSIWHSVPRDGNPGWFLVGAAVVTVALAVVEGRPRPVRLSGLIGVGAWLVLSVWSTRRGDGDGLWALAIPVYFVIAAAMLAAITLLSRKAHRRRSGVKSV